MRILPADAGSIRNVADAASVGRQILNRRSPKILNKQADTDPGIQFASL